MEKFLKSKYVKDAKNYITNAFEGRNHGINIANAFDTLINSTISHFRDHLIAFNKHWNEAVAYKIYYGVMAYLLNRLVMHVVKRRRV